MLREKYKLRESMARAPRQFHLDLETNVSASNASICESESAQRMSINSLKEEADYDVNSGVIEFHARVGDILCEMPTNWQNSVTARAATTDDEPVEVYTLSRMVMVMTVG